MMTKWLQSKVVKVLYGALLGLILTGLLGAFPNTAFAACSGNGCNGKYANDQGCTTNNSTVGELTTAFPAAHVELRKSTSCNAKWTRATNISGYTGWTAATSWWPPYAYPANLQYSITSATVIANNAYMLSKMLGPGYPVQACGKVSAIKAVPIPIAQNLPGYCTLFVGS